MDKRGKGANILFAALLVSTLVFLGLHAVLFPVSNPMNESINNMARTVIFGLLLFFVYRGFNWAIITFAVLSALLVIGVAAIMLMYHSVAEKKMVLCSLALLCMIANTVILVFYRKMRTPA